MTETTIDESLRADVETLWRYHDMRHELRPCDVGIGLGSHDLGVAVVAVDLFHQGMFPLVVFSGANAPTTVDRFPRGEAVHIGSMRWSAASQPMRCWSSPRRRSPPKT